LWHCKANEYKYDDDNKDTDDHDAKHKVTNNNHQIVITYSNGS